MVPISGHNRPRRAQFAQITITGVPVAVYGRSESAVLDRLRKMYPQWRNFVLLDVRWTS